VRGIASTAHVYGKPIVATESFTGGGYQAVHAEEGRRLRVREGVNRLVFHTSAHQPLDTKPGNAIVGTHIHRNITWAEQAAPLMTYFARTSFMLQQGRFVADLAYLLREGAPSTMPFWGAGLQPALPAGYDYDFVSTDVLLNRMSVAADGRLTLPDGLSYRVLVLPEIDRMTVPVLRKIRDLVAGGATIVGPRPAHSPSLAGYPDADREIQAIAADVWGDATCTTLTQQAYGKGRVICGRPVADAHTVPKDFEASRPLDSNLVWIHRASADADLYFVANRTDERQLIEARCRVHGKAPELWHPDTRAIEPANYSDDGGLAGRESVFVVFRHRTTAPARSAPAPVQTALVTLHRPWDVAFAPNLGAPPAAKFGNLESWTANADLGIKYFSGTASYRQIITAPHEWLRENARVLLDLGVVKDIADVSLSGKPLGVAWKPPYSFDITGILRTGTNDLQITNESTNRILGDRLGPPDKPVFPAPAGPAGGGGGGFGFGPQQPLESALLGPVRIISSRRLTQMNADRNCFIGVHCRLIQIGDL
jgi:hypothetical protein